MEKEEVKKDDSVGFLKTFLAEKLERNPKETLKIMIIAMVVSIVGVVLYNVFVPVTPMKPISNISGLSAVGDPLTQGIGDLINAGSAVKESYELEGKINKLLTKEVLTRQDSLSLLELFEELKDLNERVKPKLNKP